MKDSQGLSLIEVLIVLAIVVLFISLGFFAFPKQIKKVRDSQRKEDLEKIRVAFEDYYSDTNCYPPLSVLDNCGGDDLRPYLDKIPCDPVTKQPYKHIGGLKSLDNPNCFFWFKVYTWLENEGDLAIAKLGLDRGGPYAIDGAPVNYGVASPNETVSVVPSSAFVCPTGVIAEPVACSSFPEGACGTLDLGCCPYSGTGYIYLICNYLGYGYCCPAAE